MTTQTEALAQQSNEQGCEHCNHSLYCGTKCKNCGKQSNEQVEPVAWANRVIGGSKWLSIHASKGASDKWLEYRVKEQAQGEEYEQIAFYTHPPVPTAQPKPDLKPRCFADFQPNHEHDRKCQWCAVETECKTGMTQPKEPVAFIDEQGTLRYYKPSDFNQCEYGGLIRLYKE